MPPHHWLRFGRSSTTAVGFVEDVAAGSGASIIVHQYPAWTKAGYTLAEMKEMVKLPEVVMVKMGTRDMARWRCDYEELKAVAPHVSIRDPQFHPDDPSLLRFGGRNEIVTVVWPHGMIGIKVDSGAVRRVTDFPAWHPSVSRNGGSCVTDTKNPDRGLFLFDTSAGPTSPAVPLAESRSSNAGDHWNGDHCPYDESPLKVFAPQHTHPHPAFSPDGSRVVFMSDTSGVAQFYEVTLR